jgi:uncharacterized OB-fold protein
MAQQTPPRPVPIPTNITEEYWGYINQGELRMPFCLDCQAFFYYPRPICQKCMGKHIEYRPVSGKGTVYSYTVIRSPQPAFRGMEPYVVANVELAEGVRMMTNILTDDVDSVKIGMPVKLVLQQVTPDLKMPQFEPA